MLLKKMMVMTATLAAAGATLMSGAGIAHADPGIAGTFNTVDPTRILDTRAGIGADEEALAPGATLTFDATDGVDGDAGAVALTITAVNPTQIGWIVAYPSGVPRPLASTVNFEAGRTTPNSTVVKVGDDGLVSIYNGSAGSVDVLADLTGWWSAGTVDADTAGALTTVTPARVLDTRLGRNVPLAPRTSLSVPVLGRGGVPATGVSAIVANLTAAGSVTSGYLTAGAEPEQPELRTSNLNFLARQSRANLVTVPVNTDGTISIYNGAPGAAHVVLDVLGYVNAGTPAVDGAFLPSTSFRVSDTRTDVSPLPALVTGRFPIFPADDPTTAIFKAVVVTVTGVLPQDAGFFTVWDGTTSLPPTSNSNFFRGQDGAVTTIVPVNPDGTISVYNGSYGNLDVVIDVNGFVLNDLTTPGARAMAAKTRGGTPALVAGAIARAKQLASS